jgi:hypothetical protein
MRQRRGEIAYQGIKFQRNLSILVQSEELEEDFQP